MPLFTGTGLVCVRGPRAVFAELGFALDRGGALVLRGPNGSGKTSLLRLMAGLGRPRAGHLAWDGVPIAEDPVAHAARLAFAGPLDAVKPALTVLENLAFWTTLSGRTHDDARRALDRWGLGTLADTPGRFLSTGQRQRLALARVLVRGTPLWLLDEPTAGLDADGTARLEELAAGHRARGGMVAVATHTQLALDDAVCLSPGDFRREGEL